MKSAIYLFLLILLCTAAANNPVSSSLPAGYSDLDVKVHFAPNLIPFQDKFYFIYELELSNNGNAPLQITGLEVRDGITDSLISSYDHHQIQIRYLDNNNAISGEKRLTGDIKGLAYMWVEFPRSSPIPQSIKNVVIGKDSKTSFTVTSPAITVPAGNPVVIGSPFKEGTWVVSGGPFPTSLHRITVLPVAGPVYLAQRFAIDWISVNDKGRAYIDDGSRNEDWDCYNKDLVAVADGIVVETRDDLPENTPGLSPVIEINKETIIGNHVVLQIADSQYVLYAHMVPNSIIVKAGDKVKKGDILGKLGNSGNSGAPHLHLHVTNGRNTIFSEGIAYVYDSFRVLGSNFSAEALLSGGNVFNSEVFEKKESTGVNELPLQNWIIKF